MTVKKCQYLEREILYFNMEKLFNFINKSISPFHGVAVIKSILEENGFLSLNEASKFNLEAGKSYYVVRNDASIIAFKLPKNNSTSFKIVASHLDSPTFKIKPNGEITQAGYKLLNTEVYGGPIFSTWFDRPLGISGRVVVKENNKLVKKLVNFENSCVIPNIAIHMNREINNGYKYNPQVDTLPIYSSNLSFNEFLSKSLNVELKDIKGMDLFLYNQDKGQVVGIDNEFFVSPRIDNLECAYTSLEAFIRSNTLEDQCNVYASFNHEEVGSSSDHGANSTFLIDVLRKIVGYENIHETLARSIIVSADNAHAVHPAAPGKSDPTSKAYMNRGIVIKNAANLSYTTDGYSAAILKTIWDEEGILYQENANNSAVRGGSTLGCISLKHVSITSVDIGLAQLAMHSANETAGTKDVENMVNGLTKFYNTNICINNDEVEFN